MSSLEQYREQQLAAFRQHNEQVLQQLRAQLQQGMEAFVEEKISHIRETIRQSNEDAIARFNKGMADMKSHPRKWPSALSEANTSILKTMLETTLLGNKTILDAFVSRMRRELENYKA